MTKKIHNLSYLKKRRQQLRNNLTSPEAHLWTALQRKQLEGRKFRRQHSVNNFIVDFYCPEEKLIIELDGSIHRDVIIDSNDFERDKELHLMGFKVLRFDNEDVENNIEGVLDEIKNNFNK